METLNEYPVNITPEELMDCYFEHNPEFTVEKFIDTFWESEDGQEECLGTFIEMTHCYMQSNYYDKGEYLVVYDSYGIVKSIENDGSIKKFFIESGIDLTHLIGYEKHDLVVLVIPCAIVKNIDKIIKILNNIRKIELWSNNHFV